MRIEARDPTCNDHLVVVSKFGLMSEYLRRGLNYVSALLPDKRRNTVLPLHDISAMRDVGLSQSCETMNQLHIDNEMQQKSLLEVEAIRHG